jgi:hypothetical protein
MTESMQLDGQAIMEDFRVKTEALVLARENHARAEQEMQRYEAQIRITCLQDSNWLNAKNDTVRQAVRDATIHRTQEENDDYARISQVALDANIDYNAARLEYDLIKTWVDLLQAYLRVAEVQPSDAAPA